MSLLVVSLASPTPSCREVGPINAPTTASKCHLRSRCFTKLNPSSILALNRRGESADPRRANSASAPEAPSKDEQKKDRFHLRCKTQETVSTGNARKHVQRDEDYGAGEQDCVYRPCRNLNSTRGHVNEPLCPSVPGSVPVTAMRAKNFFWSGVGRDQFWNAGKAKLSSINWQHETFTRWGKSDEIFCCSSGCIFNYFFIASDQYLE
jgi:hypothetical protein